MAEVPPALRPAFVAYLERKSGTCQTKTVSGLATRLAHFGVFLGQIDPGSVRSPSWTGVDTSSLI